MTIAFDTPGSGAHDKCSELGKGTAIKLYDGAMITDRRVVNFMEAVAIENKIAYQFEMLAAGGTDAGAMQRFTAGGAITGAVSIPVRNVHQSIEMCHKDDMDGSVALLKGCFSALTRWDWSWNDPSATQLAAAAKPARKCGARKCGTRKK